MEKRTIGKFISALRRANGMTQRELAERLFVSDKTVSRWERDESTPEITLIPVIAELFGVTSDELIRGERISSEKVERAEEERCTIKTEKSIRALLHEKNKRHGNSLIISVGLSLLGLIASMIADLAFSEGLIGFFIALAFALAGEISVICFTRNALVLSDDGDFSCGADEIRAFNRGLIGKTVRLSIFNIGVIAFCLPLVTATAGGVNFGLSLGAWSLYGAVSVAVALAVTYILRVLWLDKVLEKRGFISLGEERSVTRRILSRFLLALVVIEAVLLGGAWFNYQYVFDLTVDKQVFYTCDSFKSYVEADVAQWRENMGYETEDGAEDKLDLVMNGQIYDSKGKLICEYEYLPHLYKYVRFTASSDDKTPITLITYPAGHAASAVVDTVGGVLILCMIFTLVSLVTCYSVVIWRIKKR